MSKVKAVEGVRGTACLLVVFSHLSLTFFPYLHALAGKAGSSNQFQGFIHNSPFGFIYSGTAAVYIFFVLSGYILTYAALTGNSNTSSKLIAMSLKRYPRLMIPTTVSCVLAYVLFASISTDKTMLTDWIIGYGKFNYSFIGAIYSGSVESFILGRSSYNWVLWTMKIELIGSFLVFIICFLRTKVRGGGVDFLCTAIIITLMAFRLLSISLGLGFIAFISGHTFYYYGRPLPSTLAIPMFIFGLYLAGTHNDSSSYFLLSAIAGSRAYELGNFVSGILIVYAAIFNDELNALFSNKALVFMGKLSFSVYLIHLSIISTFGVLVFNLCRENYTYDISAILSSCITILSTYLMAIFYFYSLLSYNFQIKENCLQTTG